MYAKLTDASVERFDRTIGSRLHDGAFHHRQHERRDLVGAPHPGRAQARFDRLLPGREILRDQKRCRAASTMRARVSEVIWGRGGMLS